MVLWARNLCRVPLKLTSTRSQLSFVSSLIISSAKVCCIMMIRNQDKKPEIEFSTEPTFHIEILELVRTGPWTIFLMVTCSIRCFNVHNVRILLVDWTTLKLRRLYVRLIQHNTQQYYINHWKWKVNLRKLIVTPDRRCTPPDKVWEQGRSRFQMNCNSHNSSESFLA